MCSAAFGLPLDPEVNRTTARSDGRAAECVTVAPDPRGAQAAGQRGDAGVEPGPGQADAGGFVDEDLAPGAPRRVRHVCVE